MSKRTKYIVALCIFIAVLVIDQIIKVNVKTGMYLGERIEITSWFQIVFVENEGMAFGWELWGGKLFLTLFRVVAVCIIAWFICKEINRERPLGYIICHKYDSHMVYLVNDILMSFKGLAPLCVPINKTGRNGRNFPKMVEAAFQSKKNVVMFPAGLCSRKGEDGIIKDIEWKKTFITKSIQYQRDVIPVHFSGQNSDRFYNIARWCKRLHIKFNIAMLYLADEMYKNQGKTFTVTFGEPIPWQTFNKSKTPTEWAQWVKEKVYQLQEE